MWSKGLSHKALQAWPQVQCCPWPIPPHHGFHPRSPCHRPHPTSLQDLTQHRASQRLPPALPCSVQPPRVPLVLPNQSASRGAESRHSSLTRIPVKHPLHPKLVSSTFPPPLLKLPAALTSAHHPLGPPSALRGPQTAIHPPRGSTQVMPVLSAKSWPLCAKPMATVPSLEWAQMQFRHS